MGHLEITPPTSTNYFWAQRLVDSIQKEGKKELSPDEQNFFLHETAEALRQLNQAPIKERREFIESVVADVKGLNQDPKVSEPFADRYRILLGQALDISI